MKIYRLSKTNYIKDLSGEGARLYGGRWNNRGEALLYFSEHLSLCVLELLTRIDYEFLEEDYSFIEVEVPKTLITILNDPKTITEQWRSNPPNSYTQDYGSNWIKKRSSFGLAVPTAVLPLESNILIKPNHKEFYKLKILQTGILDLDSRVI
jgi:RES domain-containing protein